MGSPEGEKERDSDEGPQHEVTVENGFAVGKSAVTRAEFAEFVKETGHKTDGGCIIRNSGERFRWDSVGKAKRIGLAVMIRGGRT